MIRDNGNVLRAAGSVLSRAALVGLVGLGAAGCTDWALYDLDAAYGEVDMLSTMRTSVSFDPYEMPRLPAPGTVPVAGPGGGEYLPAFTQAQLDSVGAAMTNPLPMTPEVLALGQSVYETQCIVCHGPQGEGNGPVVGPGKYPLGPSLTIDAAAARADGYIYGIIRVGRGLMPAYGEKVSHTERWAVVNYVRTLQGRGGATAPAAAPAGIAPADSVTPVGAPGVVDTAQALR